MNKKIIKNFKLKIYLILILLTTHKNKQMIYYIIIIYLNIFICEQSYLRKNRRKHETQIKKIKEKNRSIV